MKRNTQIVLITLMVLLCHGVAFGAEETYLDRLMMSESNPKNRLVSGLTDGRLSINVAYKMWVAEWQSFAFITTSPGEPSVAGQFTSDTKLFSGPSITAAYRFRDSEWFHSAGANFTWLKADDWKFSDATSTTTTTITIEPKGTSRRDFSVTGSVAIWRGIGMFAGYYNSKQNLNLFNVKFIGPLIGMYGSGALNKWLGIYGNLGVAFLKYKKGSGSTISDDVQGYSAECGFNINGPDVWKVGTGLQLGYRAQVIRIDTSSDSTANDVTWGPIFSIVAKF